MKAAAETAWENTEDYRTWLRLARINKQNNTSSKENPKPPEEKPPNEERPYGR